MTQSEKQVLELIEANPLVSQQELAQKTGLTRSSVGVYISNLMKKGYILGKGYLVRTSPYIVVIGGLNRDIGAQALAPLLAEESNPARITTSLGGVGWNIAHNASLLGAPVKFISALGTDDFSAAVRTQADNLGMDLKAALVVPGAQTSTYIFIAGPDGNMALAAADMEILTQLSPLHLKKHLALINQAALVVVDTNVTQEALQFLVDYCTVPLFADPVSCPKATKLKPILGSFHTLKPNWHEALFLAGYSASATPPLASVAEKLLATGLKRVFISLGKNGVYAADHAGGSQFFPPPGHCVNTTGCGDAFMAALAWAELSEENSLATCSQLGLGAASIAMESQTTVNPVMNSKSVQERAALCPLSS